MHYKRSFLKVFLLARKLLNKLKVHFSLGETKIDLIKSNPFFKNEMNRFLRNKKGFTLIELLVVIAIIGILALIALSHFSSATRQSWNAAAKSSVKNAYNAAQAFYIDSPSGTVTPAILQNYGYTPDPNVSLNVVDGSLAGLSITASYNQPGTQTYSIDNIGTISP